MSKAKKIDIITGTFISLCLAFLLVGQKSLFNSDIFVNGISYDSCISIIRNLNFISYLLVFLLLETISYSIIMNKKAVCGFLYKYRFHIAISILIVLVLLEISGSSISSWSIYDSSIQDKGVLFGKFRTIRSDEWAVNTPMALSQYFDDGGTFNYFSNIIRGTSTDSFIVYGQPVMDVAVIFRPFHWGYLFLSPAKGLSFFWCSRLIALLLISFEMGMIITNKNKKLSIAYMMLVGFSPIIQWWFAVNGLVEMFVYGQLALIMLKKYMITEGWKKRIIYISVITICAGGYILTFYPAQQIPLFYVFVGLAIWVILENYKEFKFNYKRDGLVIGIAIVFLLSVMAHILLNSFETIKTVMDTVYPGSRIVTGGDEFNRLFQYPTNFFLPFNEHFVRANLCEDAMFIDFFPLGFILMGFVIFKNKLKDKALIILTIVDVILILFCSTQWPTYLAKITLLGNCTPIRIFAAIGFVNVIILIRALSLVNYKVKITHAALFSASMSLLTVVLCNSYADLYMSKTMCILSFLILLGCYNSILLCLRNGRYENLFVAMISIVMIFSGFSVNPIQKGIPTIDENPMVVKIKEFVDKDKEALWAVETEGFPIANIPIMAGAATINSTNVYPALERWKSIDVNNEFEVIYNRYAHIRIELTNDTTKFVLENTDAFSVYLNINDIKKLDIKYIIGPRDLTIFNNDQITFQLLDEVNGRKIYRINYVS